MKQYPCRVVENVRLWADVQQMTFDAPELALTMRPGQFALIRDPRSLDPYLRRRALFYSSERGIVTLTLSSADPIVARTREGDLLDVLAPLGRAVEWPDGAQHILFIGEGAKVVPLVGMAHRAVQQGKAVVLSMLTATDREVLPAHLLPPEVEYQTGGVLNAELVSWSDAMFASGSAELYQSLGDIVRAMRYRLEQGFLHVLVDLAMPCGTGGCYACAVETARGIRLACTDGPVFDWMELENRRAR